MRFQNVPFIAVTSFLCLRFISPAIMAPKLFHLRERHADARTSRTLLLLAKVWDCGHWRDAQLGLEQGFLPGLQRVPHWLQESLWQATDTLTWHCPPVDKAFSRSPSLLSKGAEGGGPRLHSLSG